MNDERLSSTFRKNDPPGLFASIGVSKGLNFLPFGEDQAKFGEKLEKAIEELGIVGYYRIPP